MLDRPVVVGDKLKSTVNTYGLWTVMSVGFGSVEISNGIHTYKYTQDELKDFMNFAN